MFSSKKPFTAVSVQIDQLTMETYEENDLSGIPELIEVIRLQDSGPQEASRAIRKKLKYGNIHRQLRALTILDALIENAGKRFQRSFADEPLLERLRVLGSDSLIDPDVRKKARILFSQWANAYKDTPGMTSIAGLYRQLPQKQRPRPQPRPPSPDDEPTPSANIPSSPPRGNLSTPIQDQRYATHSRNNSASGSSSLNSTQITLATAANLNPALYKSSKSFRKDKDKRQPFNLEKEKPVMIQNIANASVASTNLKNSLKFVNREKEQLSANEEVMKRFETCKLFRRQILRYIQFVESEQWLGGLIHANEELVEALTLFEVLDKPIGQDSDSEGESTQHSHEDHAVSKMAKMKLGEGSPERRRAPLPPNLALQTDKQKQRAQPPASFRDDEDNEEQDNSDVEADDPNNPFGDGHALNTPKNEKGEPRWTEV